MRIFPLSHPSVATLLVLLSALVFTTSAAASIWVITDSRHPVAGNYQPDRFIELDAAQRIEAEISAHLPDNETQATALMQQRLQQGETALEQRLLKAYQGITDAWSLGVAKIPAVVVDKRYVVYGEQDLDRALRRIEQYRKKEMQP